MIDRKKLAELVVKTKLCLLSEIQNLTEACKMLDTVAVEIDGPASDNYLTHLIAINMDYRFSLIEIFNSFEGDERAFWNEMRHIDDNVEGES